MGNILVEQRQDGSVKYRYSSESAGVYVRHEEHAYGIVSPIPANVPNDTDLFTGTVPVRKPSQSETFFAERLAEYNLCKKYYDPSHKMLCVFVKIDNTHKHMVAVTVQTNKGIVWFDIRNNKLVARAVLHCKVSNDIMRSMIGAKPYVHVYSQNVREIIRTFESKHSDRAHSHGMQANAPHDRKAQRYILRGRPIQDVERVTRQDTELHARPYDKVAPYEND